MDLSVIVALVAEMALWIYATIFFHEIGHYLAAKIAGFRPYLVVIGRGPSVTIKGKKTDFQLGLFPSSGIVYSTHPPLNWEEVASLKFKQLVYSSGGLALNLALLIGALFAFIEANQRIAAYFFIYELIFIFINVIPRKIKTDGIKINSDGKSVSVSLKTDYKLQYETLLESYSKRLARYGAENKDIFDRDLTNLIELSDAESLIEIGHYSYAFSHLENLLTLPNIGKFEFGMVTDMVVSLVIDYHQAEYLAAAEKWNAISFDCLKENLTVAGSRGAILAELEKYAESKEILHKVVTGSTDKIDLVIGYCYLAKCEHFLGRSDVAAEMLKFAEQVETENELLNRHIGKIRELVSIPA